MFALDAKRILKLAHRKPVAQYHRYRREGVVNNQVFERYTQDFDVLIYKIYFYGQKYLIIQIKHSYFHFIIIYYICYI